MILESMFRDTVSSLERESGYLYDTSCVNVLRESILSNDIRKARSLLSQVTLSHEVRMACIFLLSQQSFATALYNDNLEEAIRILSEDLSLTAFDEETEARANKCASLIMYPSPRAALSKELAWDMDTSCTVLWSRIEKLLSPEMCVPSNRLLTLLYQAVELQELYCKNHFSWSRSTVMNLYEDHSCASLRMQTRCIARLHGHLDEVWDIKLSPCGTYVASGSKDGTVILWHSKSPFEQLNYWKHHRTAVSCIAWSSDSTYLASADREGVILLWMPGYLSCVGRVEPCYGVPMCMSWIPNTHTFLVGGFERDVVLYYVEKGLRRGRHRNSHYPGANNSSNSPDIASSGNTPENVNLLEHPSGIHDIAEGTIDDIEMDESHYEDSEQPFTASDNPNDPADATTSVADTGDVEGSYHTCSDYAESDFTNNEAEDPFYYIHEVKRAVVGCRVRNIAINFRGDIAVLSAPDHVIRLFDIVQFTDLSPLPDNSIVTSLYCSKLYNQVLVSTSGKYPVMRLWDLDERRIIQTYRGHREERFDLKCAMGGPDEMFVISGSEDAQIYIWNKVFGSLIRVLKEHTSAVNAVTWSIVPWSHMFSAADDYHLGVWEIKNDTEE
uniref:WD domain, G-beta repeat containing protein n=1 Tax=Babesia bovis TaxID=5865 RepID=A7ATM3_BABBO|eukprot:XP_001609852.1 WD domain, G-beta repeat containing protein [Babesia bovis T2Bo]